MKKNILSMLLLAVCMFFTEEISAQGIAINNTGLAADSSAMLDIDAIDKGLLIPRMSESQRNAIVNPAEGLIVYNLTTGCLNYFHSSLWYQWCGTCIPPATPVAASNGPLCSGDTLFLTASTVVNANYYWTGPNGFTSSLQNPAIPGVTTAASGVYSVVASINGCNSNPGTVSATVNQTPSASFTYNPSSPSIGASVSFTPAVSGATYLWTFQGGTPSSSTAQNPVVTWTTAGNYDVSLTVTQQGCTSSSAQNIAVINCPSGSQTFSYTSGMQTFTVPACVSSVRIECWGAQGNNGLTANGFTGGTGGLGGYTAGDLSVTGGSDIYIFVGGSGGYNGGGAGGNSGGGPGGGASDVRYGGTSLSNRVIVAGGGGGGGAAGCTDGSGGAPNGGNGGGGGGISGTAGGNTTNGGPGQGGTLGAGGAKGVGCSCCLGGDGTAAGVGGNGTDCCCGGGGPRGAGGGGGGGYVNGGGGGGGSAGTTGCSGNSIGAGGGGGGGSNYTGGVTGTIMNVPGNHSGNGQIVITY